MKRKSQKILRIAILVETSSDWGRQLIEGIGRYSRRHELWNCFVEPHGLNERLIRYPPDWRPDGIIARVHTREMQAYLADADMPVVNVSGTILPGPELPRVAIDEPACVRMALKYLTGLGLRQFAYYGDPTLGGYAGQRLAACCATVRDAGFDCASYNPSPQLLDGAPWGRLQADRGRWLAGLPKPLGVITWGAAQARCVADSCLLAGLGIPEDVAIIGIDSDRLMSIMTRPSLSGVRLSSRQQGYAAAEMLAALMRGEEPQSRAVYIAPLGIVPRESTNMLAVADHLVRRALQYIRARACDNIGVEDVVHHCSTSRRSLERKFKEWLGNSPAGEIRRVKLECVRMKLVDSDMQVGEIADECGWHYVEHLIPAFRKEFGMTPLQYRKKIAG